MDRISSLVLIIFITCQLQAQDCYQKLLLEGNLAREDLRYTEAIEKFVKALDCKINPKQKKILQDLINQTTQELSEIRDLDLGASQKAIQAMQQAKQAQQESLVEVQKAKRALAQAEQTLRQIYFYENKVAIAKDSISGHFGLIDRQGRLLTECKYSFPPVYNPESQLFEVQQNGETYRIDLQGKAYLTSTNSKSMLGKVICLDLYSTKLKNFPKEAFENPQLEVIILGSKGKGIKSLPTDFSKLVNLRRLVLCGNPIPESEKEHLKKALPNCEIRW